jgi:hypothetical protein
MADWYGEQDQLDSTHATTAEAVAAYRPVTLTYPLTPPGDSGR